MAKSKSSEMADLSIVEAVPAERAGGGAGETTKPPPFGSPRPVGEGAVPRVIDELGRVDTIKTGLRRYKIDCHNYTPQPRKYVLAKDEDSARECYLSASGLGETISRMKKNGISEIEQPDLVVTALAD